MATFRVIGKTRPGRSYTRRPGLLFDRWKRQRIELPPVPVTFNGQDYFPGEEVESDLDLVVVFPDRFMREDEWQRAVAAEERGMKR